MSFQGSVASLMSVSCVATVNNLMGTLSRVWCCPLSVSDGGLAHVLGRVLIIMAMS